MKEEEILICESRKKKVGIFFNVSSSFFTGVNSSIVMVEKEKKRGMFISKEPRDQGIWVPSWDRAELERFPNAIPVI